MQTRAFFGNNSIYLCNSKNFGTNEGWSKTKLNCYFDISALRG